MDPTLTSQLQSLVALLAIVNPVSAIPLFLAFTADNPAGRARVAAVASLSVATVLVVSVLGGEFVLQLFGITIPAFRIAGGIIVFLIGLAMLQSSTSRVKQTPEEQQEGVDRPNPAVVPLAIPLLSGPGAISTAIFYAHAATQRPDPTLARLTLLAVCLVVGFATWLCLSAGAAIASRLSQTVLNIITRLMGLLTAAVAIQMLVSGLTEALPGLKGLTP